MLKQEDHKERKRRRHGGESVQQQTSCSKIMEGQASADVSVLMTIEESGSTGCMDQSNLRSGRISLYRENFYKAMSEKMAPCEKGQNPRKNAIKVNVRSKQKNGMNIFEICRDGQIQVNVQVQLGSGVTLLVIAATSQLAYLHMQSHYGSNHPVIYSQFLQTVLARFSLGAVVFHSQVFSFILNTTFTSNPPHVVPRESIFPCI